MVKSNPDTNRVERVARAIGATEAKHGGPIGAHLWDVDLTNAAIAALTIIDDEAEGLRKLLGDAFGTLISIFETSDDEHTSRAAKEAADKIDAALSNRDGEDG